MMIVILANTQVYIQLATKPDILIPFDYKS